MWTAADVADIPPIDFRAGRHRERSSPTASRSWRSERVRYVGEPVAAVFAADPYVAEDAADLVALDIEELPALLDADAAPGEFEPGRSTEAAIIAKGYGDVDAGVRRAARRRRARCSRSAAIPACRWRRAAPSARYDASRDILELHGAAKVPHWNRDLLPRMLGRAPSSMHLHEGHVGGGFGIRGELYPEDVLVCVAALRLGAPGEMDRGPARASDRRQPFAPAAPRVRAAVDANGRILALDDEFLHDQGAYVRTHAATVPRPCRRHAAGTVSRAGLSRGRPLPPHQQDAGGDLSRAGPLRDAPSCASA